MITTRPGPTDNFDHSVESDESIRNKSVQGAVYMAGAGAIESVARLIATVALARLLSPEEVGLVGMIMVIIGLLEYMKDLGLGMVTIQKQRLSHREVSSLFWINVLLGLFFTLLLCSGSPVISAFYGDSRLVAIAISLSATLLMGGISIQPESLLNRQMKQGPLAFIRLTSTLSSSALAIALALAGFGYWSLVVRELARAVVYLCAIWWQARWMPSPVLRFGEVTSHLKLGLGLSLSFVQTAITRQIDVILVGRFFGPAAVGFYRQAQALIVAPIEQFNAPVFSVAQPALSALQSDADRYRRYYERVVSIVAMVTLPIGIFIAIYSREFTAVVLGEKWSAAAPFVAAFAVVMAIRPTIHTATIVLVSFGRSKRLLALESGYTLVLTILLLIGVQVSALGVAIALIAATVVAIPPRVYFSLRDSPVSTRIMLSAIRISLGSGFFMGLSLFVLHTYAPIGSPFPSLLAGIVVGAATFLLPWLLLPSARAELWSMFQGLLSAMRAGTR